MSFDTADFAVITKAVATVVREYVKRSLLPVTARLEQLEGISAKAGEPGPPGKDATPLNVDDVAAALAKLMPRPENGRDGKSVTVEDFRQLFDAEHAKWTLEFERRANDTVRRFLDKIPAPTNGKDGLGFDDLTVEHDGERTFAMRFTRGDQIKEFAFELPTMIYREIWKDGAYQAGDVVTWAGSAFIAKRDTTAKPETDDSWKLIVKRGRDGKDGAPGANGEPGRDLTQNEGRKW